MLQRRALIIGHKGQDGKYLSASLRRFGYVVIGVDIGAVDGDVKDLPPDLDITSTASTVSFLRATVPDEIYFLAAFHHSSEESPLSGSDLVVRSITINTLGLNTVLAAMETLCRRSKLFYAASSRVFGQPVTSPQDESAPLNPICPYGISKAAGLGLCRYYRGQNVFASGGILYNHESPSRPPQFVSQKLVRAAVRISRGSDEAVSVGDLAAEVDWGFAGDYVEAMRLILLLDEPTDFVIGTGRLHSVRYLAERIFAELGLDWRRYVREDPRILKHGRHIPALRADSGKLRQLTGWDPTTCFEDMVTILVREEIKRVNGC